MVLKLYVDDVRPAPDGWELAKDYAQAVARLGGCDFTHVSLDHDLAPQHYIESSGYFDAPAPSREPTGYDLAKWIVETGAWPTEVIAVHSMNPVGRKYMLDLLRKHAPDGVTVVDAIGGKNY